MGNSQHIDYRLLQQQTDDHPFPLLFCTISGAHLYGFPSADSDFDLRGTHILPWNQVLGLDYPDQTVEKMGTQTGLELDLVTHDIKKFMQLMLKNNGYVLEQLLSPLVVTTSEEHQELKSLAAHCLTRHHYHHYQGFARNQWQLFAKSDFQKIKPLLYVFRVLLTGIHLMRTGNIEANLAVLNAEPRIPLIDQLLAMKLGGAEHETFPDLNREDCENLFQQLQQELITAHQATHLPQAPTAKPALNDLLIRIRRKTIVSGED
jgi:predicted nucleotidyltransferase